MVGSKEYIDLYKTYLKEGHSHQQASALAETSYDLKQTINAKKLGVNKYTYDLLVRSTKRVPSIMYESYLKSPAKGLIKLGLYYMDIRGNIAQMKYDPIRKKIIVPKGIKTISNNRRFDRIKKWANYNYKTNPFSDPDYQNLGIGVGFALLGIKSPAIANKVFGAIKGKAVWDVIKNPTEENIANAEIMFLPSIGKRIKTAVSRRDIMIADIGELVPLKERIKQVDFLIKNSGYTIESITAKPTRKVTLTSLKNKKSMDYAYGNKIEFGTYKVGKAYPTAKYFLEGKAKRLQRIFKTGVVNIEKTYVSNLNKKYGKFIKDNLLKKGKVSESFIKKYYKEAKIEANRLGKPVAVISPKRLRGFYQAEQELIKIIPSKYKSPKLKFAGLTETGHRIYTDKSYLQNVKAFLKSKVAPKRFAKSYFEEIAKEKLEYVKGRKAIKGEYAEHGIKHLKAKEVDPYSKQYARKMNIKKFGNIFEKHDLAKVGDVESFSKYEHGQVLYDLWKSGKFPDRSIYKLKPKLQKRIAEAYAGHTPVKPRLIDSLKKGLKEGSLKKDLLWYLKNKKNPYLQDVLTLDRLDLPRAGRWNFRVNYKLLSKPALKRIYGSEKNAIKNIRFLDWKTVPSRLKRGLGKTKINKLLSRDRSILKSLKSTYKKSPYKIRKIGKVYIKQKKVSIKPYIPSKRIIGYKKITKYPRKYKHSKIPYKHKPYKPTSYKKYQGKYVQYTSRGTPYIVTKYGARFISGYKPSGYKAKKYAIYIPKLTYKAKGRVYAKRPPITPPIRTRRGKKVLVSKKITGKIPVFNVYGKSGKKFIKLNLKPLTRNDALSRGTFAIDHTTAKTFKIVPARKTKKAGTLRKNEANYFNRAGYKLREYKIRKGRAFKINPKYIERRRYGIDTRGENRGLSIAKFLKQQRTGKIQRFTKVAPRIAHKRRISPTQRKVLIQRLKKARAVRMRNLRRR
jgi:hypothetical protein